MHMYDLIEKKKRGGALSRAELDGLVAGAVSGDIPDYQLSAFLMAVYFQGMTADKPPISPLPWRTPAKWQIFTIFPV